jgi:hypothetical protein
MPYHIGALAEMEYIEPGMGRNSAAVREAALSFIDDCFYETPMKKPQMSRK